MDNPIDFAASATPEKGLDAPRTKHLADGKHLFPVLHPRKRVLAAIRQKLAQLADIRRVQHRPFSFSTIVCSFWNVRERMQSTVLR